MIVYHKGELVGGRYKIIECVHESYQSYCYKGIDTAAGKKNHGFVFIKIYHGDINRLNETRRFYQYLFCKLEKNIQSFCFPLRADTEKFEIGIKDNTIFAVFPWLDGMTLDKFLESAPDNLMKKQIVLSLLIVCKALARNNIAHLDLKPENIFVLKKNVKHTVKIIDFDTARYLPEGGTEYYRLRELSGTPCYQSPEQYEGKEEKASVKSDVFCLSIILSMILLNTYPFPGTDESGILRGAYNLPDGIIHPELKEVLERCLSPLPETRPDAEEVSHCLTKYAGTFFTHKKCGVMLCDNEHTPYYYYETVQLYGQKLRAFIRRLPAEPCIELYIDAERGEYAIKKLSNEVELKFLGRNVEANQSCFLSLYTRQDEGRFFPNITVNGKELCLYLVEATRNSD